MLSHPPDSFQVAVATLDSHLAGTLSEESIEAAYGSWISNRPITGRKYR